jgi:hypothetical protein
MIVDGISGVAALSYAVVIHAAKHLRPLPTAP